MTEIVLLHSGHAFTWTAWHPEPTLIAGVIASIALYALRLRSLPASQRPPLPRIASFLVGVALVFVALGSPLDVGADRLFALHMLQHVTLYAWAAPFLWLGITAPMLAPLINLPPLRRQLTFWLHPLIAAPIFTINMWFWHAPPIYDIALTNFAAHYTMHLSFLATGLMFWWTLAGPVELLHRVEPGWKLLYIILSGLPMMILAFALVTTPTVLYDYYETQPRTWGISALLDQQLGGIVMGSLGELTEFIPLSIIFFRLTSKEEEEAAEHPPVRSEDDGHSVVTRGTAPLPASHADGKRRTRGRW